MKRLCLLLILGCGGKTVVRSPEPAADWWGADKPVAAGTHLRVSTSWDGLCEYDGKSIAVEGEPSTRRSTCDSVEFTTEIHCDDNACTQLPGKAELVPTRAGELRAHVTLVSKHDRKTFDLKPIVVGMPTAATTSCELANSGAKLAIALQSDRGPLVHEASVAVHGGGACKRESKGYTCPVTTNQPVQLDVSSSAFSLTIPVTCHVAFAVDAEGELIDDNTVQYVLEGTSMQTIVAVVRDRLKQGGWTITTEHATDASADFEATHTGERIHVALTGNTTMRVVRL